MALLSLPTNGYQIQTTTRIWRALMKTKLAFTSLALALMLGSGAALADIKVGVAMSQFDDTWLTYLRQDMGTKAKSMSDGVTLQFVDARADVNKQIDQVKELINKKVDALIVNPVDTAATARITKEAVAAGIPLVYVNRRPDDSKLPAGVATVTSDDTEAGRLQAQYVADKMGGKGSVMILLGDLANNSTQNRTKGIKEVLAKYPDIKIDQEQTGTWLRQKGMDLTNDWLTQGRKFNAVLANNDEMAIGAAMALKQAGVDKGKVFVAGVDGTPDGLNAVTKGDLTVSVYQDAKGQADGAIDAAVKMAKKDKVEPQAIVIPYRLITPENVSTFK
ncbi:Sugar ABC transporter, periplasmic sugar-binding protein [Pseudomonas syringae pv. antirrhini]|uniref:Sugar ABC transporter, periplasmic sugar-binding protein n=2 Tax=Pseudomonas syringae group TaxID=136849 RepID=A0A0P9NN42_9PSED|nr:Sugar ABC transporter, periplasmic sugar-binding protein [Pseudomonas syringae pv. antirrhini]RMM33184.1 Sugar ABC transporter, periplasmic sugar-binding protein [Pseudomonas syringae pv. berberidis]RMP36401.1 Sugar ABC transporter, periplasmic sugar-binding protein [Pseudomonas syringae pv. antirrhini]RMP38644.1 Sugar ABC transporter, periplasmic sugar-binding protein [Pseudomonas syringae pv. antirrhini]RMQ33990.1 Sugar ABC transporter, periplasmic sugar-binding protein [Pseudomonas syring